MKTIVLIMCAVGLVVLITLFTGCQSGPPQARPGVSQVTFRLLDLDKVAEIRGWGLGWTSLQRAKQNYSVNIVNLGTGRAQAFHVDQENWVRAALPPGRYLVSSVNNDFDNTDLVRATGGGFAREVQRKLPLRLLFEVGESHRTYYLGDVSLQLKGSPRITKDLDVCKLHLTKSPESSVLIDNDHNFTLEEE